MNTRAKMPVSFPADQEKHQCQKYPNTQANARTVRRISPIRTLLFRPISFYPAFVDLCEGSINAALFLSQAIYWSEVTTAPYGWFYKKSADWAKETRLTRRQQDTARKILKRVGFLEEKLCSIPPVVHFRVDFSQLTSAVLNLPESARLGSANAAVNLAGGAKTYKETESTTDTTSEKKQNPANSCELAGKPEKDSRFRPIMDLLIQLYMKYNRCCHDEVPFSGKQGKRLQIFLAENGKFGLPLLTACIKNRFSSEGINPAEPFEFWAFDERLMRYRNGPVDRFGKPLTPVQRPDFKSASERMRESLGN